MPRYHVRIDTRLSPSVFGGEPGNEASPWLAPGYSLLAKAVSSAVSVVKVQGGAATNRVRREISVSVATRVATNGPFW